MGVKDPGTGQVSLPLNQELASVNLLLDQLMNDNILIDQYQNT